MISSIEFALDVSTNSGMFSLLVFFLGVRVFNTVSLLIICNDVMDVYEHLLML